MTSCFCGKRKWLKLDSISDLVRSVRTDCDLGGEAVSALQEKTAKSYFDAR